MPTPHRPRVRVSAFWLACLCWVGLGIGAHELSAAQISLLDSGPGYALIAYQRQAGDDVWSQARSALVGLPLVGEPRLQVESAVGHRVSASPELSPAERAQQHPGPVVLGRTGFVRSQRVVEIIFAPRYHGDGSCQVFDRVVARVVFPPVTGETRGRGPQDDCGEQYLRRVVLNYTQARAWRRGSGRVAARPAGTELPATRVRLHVREEGMYVVTGADLEAVGVALEQVSAAGLQLFYGGGMPLDEASHGVQPRELPLIVEDGGDGRFDRQDRVLFYAEPPSRWVYDDQDAAYHYLHNLYTDDNVYWLGLGTSGSARRAATLSSTAVGAVDRTVASYRERLHEEFEQFISVQTYTIASGYQWYWENFSGNARKYPALIRNAVSDPVDIVLGFQGVSSTNASFRVSWNAHTVGVVSVPSRGNSRIRLRAAAGAQEGMNQLGLYHLSPGAMRFDFYELEYGRELVAQHGELRFDGPAGEGATEYRLAGFSDGRPRIFAVSGALREIIDFQYDAAGGGVVFRDRAQSRPGRYIVLGAGNWRRPTALELVPATDLRQPRQGADYLIITHADFRASADRLAAWRAVDARFGPPLRTRVVDIQEVYDEFSGGMLDPTAIRAFLRQAAAEWSPSPFYVLLLGDGTYDYKNNSGANAGNWIPAYQDGDSTYDEWYVSVFGDDALPDLAIGRIPVQTPADADIVVDKLLAYDQDPEIGPWQGRGLLVADDLHNPEHPLTVESMFLTDAEAMAQSLLPIDLDLRKLYVAQYPLEGQTKPRAREEFLKRYNEGSLYVTYIGHGNPDVLAHERMFVVSRDLDRIHNGRRLPLFYTAASQIGVFDDPMRVSMPEALLRRVEGGVIAMISATRVGYHTSNMLLANEFHRRMYHGRQRHVPVGMALMEAKQAVQVAAVGKGPINIRRYSLFGDPAQYLALPRYQVALSAPDSLRALGEVVVNGQVRDETGALVTDYQGEAWIQAFDSSTQSQLDGWLYQQPGVTLFRGRYPVRDGHLQAVFRVPKDITYRGHDGRISAYVWGEARPTGFGSVRQLVLAGTADAVEPDHTGPQIQLGILGRGEVTDGVRIPPVAVLKATLRDDSGINVTGETGHEIELFVDDQVFKVTEAFSVHGDYRQGSLEYTLPVLASGAHTIRLKAWDSFNNSAVAETSVEVSERDDLVLSGILFHPSPLRGERGDFTFTLALPATRARIRVFSLSGRLVDELSSTPQVGFNQVRWEPPAGLANGVYAYQIRVARADGSTLQGTAALQLLR